MKSRTLERLAPLAGVLFLALAVAAFLLPGEAPGADESTAEVVEFWTDKDTENVISAILGALAGVALVWFGGSLRDAIARAEGGTGRLAALTFAGTVIAGVGLMTNSAIQFAAAESAGEVPDEVTQALAVLWLGFFFPLSGGFALMVLASGLAALRTGVLPRWLGWIQVVAAILFFTPAGFFLFLATIAWVAAVGVLLFRRTEAQPPPAVPPGAAVPG